MGFREGCFGFLPSFCVVHVVVFWPLLRRGSMLHESSCSWLALLHFSELHRRISLGHNASCIVPGCFASSLGVCVRIFTDHAIFHTCSFAYYTENLGYFYNRRRNVCCYLALKQRKILAQREKNMYRYHEGAWR